MPLEDWTSLEPVKFIIENEDPATLIIIRIHYGFCGPCWLLTPAFLDLMARNESYARWLQLDTAKAEGCTAYFNIKKVPTFIAIKNKLEVGRYIGSRRRALQRFIEDMVREYGWLKPSADTENIFQGFDKPTV